jgi:hypothetical protein
MQDPFGNKMNLTIVIVVAVIAAVLLFFAALPMVQRKMCDTEAAQASTGCKLVQRLLAPAALFRAKTVRAPSY